jgi:hypothetical protein
VDQPQVSPQFRILQISMGFANSAVLHALVKTGVIEQLREQPKQLPELAQACQLNADVLYRTLRFAAAIDVVTQGGEQYALTELGRLLLKDVPGSLYMQILLGNSEPFQRSWLNLAYSLATGDNAFAQVMGDPFFEYLDKHPEYGTPYHQLMTAETTRAARAITEAYDFAPFASVCDIGGGHGILLKSILTANPHLRGVLYDRESVVKDHVLADLAPRVEIQSGNFFERVPAADVLLIKNVLHNWSDEKCQVILSHCRQAMQPSARLLIVEIVATFPMDVVEAFLDLDAQVRLGGRVRTENEFNLLLQRAGMKLNRIIPTRSPLKIIEAT